MLYLWGCFLFSKWSFKKSIDVVLRQSSSKTTVGKTSMFVLKLYMIKWKSIKTIWLTLCHLLCLSEPQSSPNTTNFQICYVISYVFSSPNHQKQSHQLLSWHQAVLEQPVTTKKSTKYHSNGMEFSFKNEKLQNKPYLVWTGRLWHLREMMHYRDHWWIQIAWRRLEAEPGADVGFVDAEVARHRGCDARGCWRAGKADRARNGEWPPPWDACSGTSALTARLRGLMVAIR